jgi:hypothetical protein
MALGVAKYVESIYDAALTARAGIIKIVPPAGWLASQGALLAVSDELLAHQTILSPIRQNMNGRRGSLQLSLTDCDPIDGYSFKLEAEDKDNSPPEGVVDVDELERRCLKAACPIGKPPVYGADCPGSLFARPREGEAVCPWHLDHLDSVLSVLGKRKAPKGRWCGPHWLRHSRPLYIGGLLPRERGG